jgi:hypothetical protein
MLQRALNASVSPSRIVLGHFDEQPPDLLHDAGPPDLLTCVGPLRGCPLDAILTAMRAVKPCE